MPDAQDFDLPGCAPDDRGPDPLTDPAAALGDDHAPPDPLATVSPEWFDSTTGPIVETVTRDGRQFRVTTFTRTIGVRFTTPLPE